MGLEGKVRLKAPDSDDTWYPDGQRAVARAREEATHLAVGRRAAEASANGLLAARVGGALKRNLVEEAALRRQAEEREARWGWKHPSRARLRDLNF